MKYSAAQALTQFSTDPRDAALVIWCGRSRRSGSSLKQPTLWLILTCSCFCPTHPAEEVGGTCCTLNLIAKLLNFLPPIIQTSSAIFGSMIWVWGHLPRCQSYFLLAFGHPIVLHRVWSWYLDKCLIVCWRCCLPFREPSTALPSPPYALAPSSRTWHGPSLLFSTGRFCYYLPRLFGFLITWYHEHELVWIRDYGTKFDTVIKIPLHVVWG